MLLDGRLAGLICAFNEKMPVSVTTRPRKQNARFCVSNLYTVFRLGWNAALAHTVFDDGEWSRSEWRNGSFVLHQEMNKSFSNYHQQATDNIIQRNKLDWRLKWILKNQRQPAASCYDIQLGRRTKKCDQYIIDNMKANCGARCSVGGTMIAELDVDDVAFYR